MDYIKSIYFNDEGEGITIKFKKRIGLILTLLLMFNFLNNSTISAKKLDNNLLVSGTNGGFKAKAVKDNTKELTNQYEAKNKFGYANYITSAFDFHIFSKKATINAHTNGNIATKDLSANRQGFGTNQSTNLILTEENYFMNSVDGVSNIASDGNIVIGNKVPVAFEDNDNSLNIGTNGNKLTKDQSLRVYQEDKESISYIDIDQEFENLKTISNLLSSNKTSDGVTLSEPNGENQTINVDGSIGSSNNYYLNIPANKISDGNNKRVLNISIPDNKTLIINVDMANANINSLEKLVTKINNHENSEWVVKHDNNILWNLYDSLGANGLFTTGAEYANVGTSDYFMGTILAPNANIQYGAVNGSIIANETKQNGQESHKWDFTGHKKEASAVIEATKTLTGKDLTSGMFSFELLDKDNKVLQTVKNDANGKIKFESINYDTVGEYKYKIKEVKESLVGITYDERVFDVTVNVTDDGKGDLVAVANYPENGVVFTNKYEPKVISTEVYLEATKTLTGKELSPEMFSFELLDKDNKVLQTVKNDANGKIQFKAINYNKTGSYNYKIKEVKESLVGIIYDERVFDVTVNVTDNGDGKLVAIVNYLNNKIEFTNKYEPKVIPTEVYLEATKTLTGKDLTSGMFSFNLLDDNGKIIENVKNDGDGKIKFNTLNFDKIGTYIYKIVEVKGDLPGVTYDSQDVDVVITVTDNGEGKLKAEVKYPNKTPEFNNSYKDKATSVALEATKILEGKDLTSGMFSFELLDKDEVIDTTKNNSDGKIQFKAINYTETATYNYKIREVKGTIEGITYDEKVFDVTVIVTDDEEGKLVAIVNYPEEGIVFTNKYEPKVMPTDVYLEATKTLTGKDLNSGMFSFKLLDDKGNIIETIKNDGDGKIKFSTLNFNEVGTYTYKIVEVNEGLGGITYDSQAVDVVITVTDNGEGKLKAEVKYPNKAPEFNNNYKADPASLVIKANKKLIGMDLTSGIFSFQLLGKDGSLLIAKNNSDGTIEFSPITYDSVGNYEYTLKEVKGNLPGIIYDESELKIIVNVEDDGKGKLVANLVDPEVNLVFENKLIKGSLEILKTDAKDGKPLKDVEFTIRDSEGNIVKVGKTDDNGKIVFEDLKYGEYTCQETLAKEGYVIDNKEYPFEIKENGVVVKASIINERKPETPNKPETPSKPQAPNKPSKSGSPNTGDNGLAVALIIGALGVGGLVINNKKKIKEKN